MEAEYFYNSDGLRISKKVNGNTTNHVWDGDQMVLETDGAGNVTNKYIRGINLIYSEDSGANRRYFLYNGHGDTVQLTSATGSSIKTYDYDAFGNEKNSDPNDTNMFRYCGEYFDKETGTIYLRARYYDPTIGRFITEDSVWSRKVNLFNLEEKIDYSSMLVGGVYRGEKEDKYIIDDPLSLNLYTYCENSPINMIDPTGNSGEFAAWSGSMWWLCGVDGPLPVGDIVYGAGAAGTAIYEYGPAVANWVGTYGPAAVDTVSNGWSWLKNKASNIFKAKDSSKNEQHGDGGRALEKRTNK